jgi:hypothetical protein
VGSRPKDRPMTTLLKIAVAALALAVSAAGAHADEDTGYAVYPFLRYYGFQAFAGLVTDQQQQCYPDHSRTIEPNCVIRGFIKTTRGVLEIKLSTSLVNGEMRNFMACAQSQYGGVRWCQDLMNTGLVFREYLDSIDNVWVAEESRYTPSPDSIFAASHVLRSQSHREPGT